jgi:trehalose 6-phosphate synthase/phosphatase
MELKVHPELRQPLTALCSDPNTTVVVLSGSGRKVLDDVFLGTLFVFFMKCYRN